MAIKSMSGNAAIARGAWEAGDSHLQSEIAADCKSHIAERTLPVKQGIHDQRLAVVGSGPAGLAAALELARWGYSATIYCLQAF